MSTSGSNSTQQQQQSKQSVGPEVVGPVKRNDSGDRFKLTPSQHLFSQLVVGLANGLVSSGTGLSRITPATARDIVTAARNLAQAIEEVQ